MAYPHATKVVAAWSLDGTTEDAAGAHDLTLSGSPSYAAGTINNGLDLENGTTQFAGVTGIDETANVTRLSASWWVKPETLLNFGRMLVQQTGTTTTEGFFFGYGGGGAGGNDDLLIAINKGSASNYGYTNANLISTGNLAHCGVVFDGAGATNADRLKIYINGAARAVTFNGTIPTTTTLSTGLLFQLGKAGSDTAVMFDGVIDEVVLWAGAALSAGDMTRLYNSGNGLAYSPPGLVRRYTLQDNAPSLTVLDSSGSAQHGTAAQNTDTTAGAGFGTALTSSWHGDGSASIISIPSVTLSGEFTVTWWADRDGTASAHPVIGENSQDTFVGYDTGNNAYLSPSTEGSVETAGLASTTDAHHMAIVRGSDDLWSLYQDGALVTADAMGGELAADITFDSIGGMDGVALYFDGRLGDLRIYNEAKTAGEIAAIMAEANLPASNSSLSASLPATFSPVNVTLLMAGG